MYDLYKKLKIIYFYSVWVHENFRFLHRKASRSTHTSSLEVESKYSVLDTVRENRCSSSR